MTRQVRATEDIWDRARAKLVPQGTALTLLYEDKDTVRLLDGRDEFDALPWMVSNAPDVEAPDPLPIPTYVAIAARGQGAWEGLVLAAPSPSHADEEELPSVGLLVGESVREAAARAAWEAGVGDVEVGEVLVDEVVPGLADRSERRIVLLGVVPPCQRADAMFYPPGTLVRGRFNFAIERVVSHLAPKTDEAPGGDQTAEGSNADGEPQAPWVPCDCCDNFLCTIHGGHVHDCPCPPIEEWETDPYEVQPA